MIVLAKDRRTVLVTSATHTSCKELPSFNDNKSIIDKRFRIMVTKMDGFLKAINPNHNTDFVTYTDYTTNYNKDVYTFIGDDGSEYSLYLKINEVNNKKYVDISFSDISLVSDYTIEKEIQGKIIFIVREFKKEFGDDYIFILGYDEIYHKNNIFWTLPKYAFPDYNLEYIDDLATNSKAFYFFK